MSSLKGQEVQKKAIFKPLLSNPYTCRNKWPTVDHQLQKDLLTALESNVLESIKTWNSLTREEKRKHPELKTNDANDILTGFNSIMKCLETQIQSIIKKQTIENRIKVLFVCKLDISCKLLYLHLPTVCALANVKLVSMPKGSSKRLSNALGLKNEVQLLAIRENLYNKNKFLSLSVDSQVEDLTVGFIENIKNPKLDMDVKYVLTEMPIVKKNNHNNNNKNKIKKSNNNSHNNNSKDT